MKILYLLILSITVVFADDNVNRNLLPDLLECYNNTNILQKDYRVPQNMYNLIEIIRKIESNEDFDMDLRLLSVALLYRFRQDGIAKIPNVQSGNGITPYSPKFHSFFRYSQILRVVPGNAAKFPNNSINSVERCSLHSMLSSTIDLLERGDEAVVCKIVNNAFRRFPRNINKSPLATDVETLSPEQIELMSKKHESDDSIDPNSLYPELPPNHPQARYLNIPYSKCPSESGVLLTNWGTVSGGPLVAGIAAALEPQMIHVRDLFEKVDVQRDFPSGDRLDSKWIATLAGDLAEVTLRQGPLGKGRYTLGATGNWNSTALPHWYFINSNENLEFTAAELRGDLDGLILASNVANWYANVPELQLSQILDMYYSPRGVFDSSIRACNRRTLLTTVAPLDIIKQQTYISSMVLKPYLSRGTIDASVVQQFSDKVINEYLSFITSELHDWSCTDTDKFNDFNHASVDLTMIIDTSWPFVSMQSILVKILEGIEIGKYNSNFTLINAKEGNIIINSTNSILDFYTLNSSNYEYLPNGFDLPTIFNVLEKLQTIKLNNEKSFGQGGQKSDVILFLSYSDTINMEQEYFEYQMYRIRKEVPDSVIIILTRGSKDKWSNIVSNSDTDLFSINMGDARSAAIDDVVSRIKRVPKRLINSKCGANYEKSGSMRSFDDYVEPFGINYYRMHANYFFSDDTVNVPTIKIQGSGWGTLTVCVSRQPLHANTTNIHSKTCSSISSTMYEIKLTCYGSSLIQDCEPYYISVSSNFTNTNTYRCRDLNVCRYPDMVKYTFSYENLVCRSSANIISAMPFILILDIIRYLFLQ